jgi:uncharacterized protein
MVLALDCWSQRNRPKIGDTVMLRGVVSTVFFAPIAVCRTRREARPFTSLIQSIVSEQWNFPQENSRVSSKLPWCTSFSQKCVASLYLTTASHRDASTTSEYETLSEPASGTPFHYAFPVHSLAAAKEFYGTVLGCQEGRSSDRWQDYSLHGHQIVCHWVGDDYRCIDYYNPVDGDEVPVPHVGLALTVDEFHDLAKRVQAHGVKFIIKPQLRFAGQPGEQYTMFFKDPSGNNLEFKAMINPKNLFAKYNVPVM